jgi:hypothetical protein
LHNRKLARFQGQSETALKNFRADLELRIKELFAGLHIQKPSDRGRHPQAAGFSPRHLLFVLTTWCFCISRPSTTC